MPYLLYCQSISLIIFWMGHTQQCRATPCWLVAWGVERRGVSLWVVLRDLVVRGLNPDALSISLVLERDF